MGGFSETIVIEAPRTAVWQELADIGSIARWNPGVVASSRTTRLRDGLGAGRRCELGGRRFLEEEVVEWVAERVLTMRITMTNLPFESADIRFTLDGDGARTRVTVSPSYTLKFGPLGRLLDAVVVRWYYRKGMVNLLRGLKQHVETRLLP
jgi:uncharacterized protein YndB with AHSA1/START domain